MIVLDLYVKDFEKQLCRIDGEPAILKERAGTAWVDGCNLLGPVVGNFCIDLAVKKAKECGVGWVVAKGLLDALFATNLLIISNSRFESFRHCRLVQFTSNGTRLFGKQLAVWIYVY
jgi:hypothetical protein